MSSKNVEEILECVIQGDRVDSAEAAILFNEADLYMLGQAANVIREYRHPENRVTFVVDRNINYTNVCVNQCAFCAFYKDLDSAESYLLLTQDILKKVDEAVSAGATQIMLQGGLYPGLDITYYIELFEAIKREHDITIHSLSAPEILHIAKNSCLTVRETLATLNEAGLDSLPGAGAEILSDKTRSRISPKKISTTQWLSIMEAAHEMGLYTTATMMFGVGEDIDERIAHLTKIRALQDKTGKVRGFIPWTFMPGKTDVGGTETSAEDYLRTLAISRIFLDNVENIQGSWLTQGEAVGQMSLFFGANDLGSTMLEENVVRATGVQNRMNVKKIVRLINKCGFTPAKRDTQYKVIKKYAAEC